jgi:hypothetical protein
MDWWIGGLVDWAPAALQEGEHLFHKADNIGFGNELAIDLNAFAKGNEMRGGEETDAQAGCAINALEHGTSGAFAVGAGDVDEAELMMRVAREVSEFECVC